MAQKRHGFKLHFPWVRACCRVMQCLMQKRSVFNFILSNYILASVLITTTNHITTRNSYRYPRARCLFSLQVPSSARKGTLVTSEIQTSYFLKIEVAYSTLFVAQILLILFNISTRRVVLLQILWSSQFTQTWPKRCRVRRHFDEVSCRYPRTLYHCVHCIVYSLIRAPLTCTAIKPR